MLHFSKTLLVFFYRNLNNLKWIMLRNIIVCKIVFLLETYDILTTFFQYCKTVYKEQKMEKYFARIKIDSWKFKTRKYRKYRHSFVFCHLTKKDVVIVIQIWYTYVVKFLLKTNIGITNNRFEMKWEYWLFPLIFKGSKKCSC